MTRASSREAMTEGRAPSMPASSWPSEATTAVTSPPYWGLRDYGAPGQIGSEDDLQDYKENLVQDYNIYVFHGTDGDDWDTGGKETIPEIQKVLTYASRVGITIAQSTYGWRNKTEVENYLISSKLLDEKSELIRLDVIQEDADEPRLIEGIKHLIS